jgi:guanine deaminase
MEFSAEKTNVRAQNASLAHPICSFNIGKRKPAGCKHSRRRIQLILAAMENPFMTRAIELAVENVRSGNGGPFGAVVVRDGRMVGEGANCVTATNDPTAHAEIVAIRKACERLGVFELRDCELYTSCEPCPMCLGAIYWARPASVFFGCTADDAAKAGFDDSLIYQEIPRPHSQRRIPMRQLMRDEALETFRAWERQPNKTPY